MPTGIPDVTVMIATYDGADRIGTCLDSLARQTLSPERFEVLVVQNGPQCDTPEVVRRFADTHPELQIRLVELRRGGLGHARNVGLKAARGRYLTYVDDDDWLTDRYLEVLLSHAARDVVSVALVSARAEDAADEGHDFDNYASRNLLRKAGRTVRSDHLPSPLNYNAGKLVSTDLARQVEYDESLRSGEDLVYWLALLALRPFRMHVVSVAEDAVYCRLMRAGSVGNQNHSYDFLVTQRLECLRALEDISTPDQVSRRVSAVMMRGQASWIRKYLREAPQDHARVVSGVRSAGLEHVPWERVNRGLADSLLILAGEPRDGGLGAVLWSVGEGLVCDVISDRDDWAEASGAALGQEMFAHHWVSPGGPGRRDGGAVQHAASVIATWQADQAPYRNVVTSGTAPFAIGLARATVGRQPDLRWVAHLADVADVSDEAMTSLSGADLVLVESEADRSALLERWAGEGSGLPDVVVDPPRATFATRPRGRDELAVAWLEPAREHLELLGDVLDDTDRGLRERLQVTALSKRWRELAAVVVRAGLSDVVEIRDAPAIADFLRLAGDSDAVVAPRMVARALTGTVMAGEDIAGAGSLVSLLNDEFDSRATSVHEVR